MAPQVLIVEDEYLVALDLQRQLEERGYHAGNVAISIDEALACAASTPLDAAVLDVNIAGKRIWPVAHLLLRRGVPFVFLTAYGVKLVEAEGLHAAPVLEKPVVIDELDCVLAGLTFRKKIPEEN